jgi:protocatechuate 4,5-dioxygenase alpha chain
MERSTAALTYRDLSIPGTTVFTIPRSRQGYRINKLAMSLTGAANRSAFKANERDYMARYALTETEMDMVARRDWAALIAAVGNIYLLLKIAGTVGQSLLDMGAQMRGEPLEAFMRTRAGTSRAGIDRSR